MRTGRGRHEHRRRRPARPGRGRRQLDDLQDRCRRRACTTRSRPPPGAGGGGRFSVPASAPPAPRGHVPDGVRQRASGRRHPRTRTAPDPSVRVAARDASPHRVRPGLLGEVAQPRPDGSAIETAALEPHSRRRPMPRYPRARRRRPRPSAPPRWGSRRTPRRARAAHEHPAGEPGLPLGRSSGVSQPAAGSRRPVQ